MSPVIVVYTLLAFLSSSLLENAVAQDAKVAAVGNRVETITEGIQNLRATRDIVEGIIAGTEEGVVVIDLNSLEQRNISSNNTRGVAFNWQSLKVYWIEYRNGIKMADLGGSSAELLIADCTINRLVALVNFWTNFFSSAIKLDTSDLRGIAVDQTTGNIYYGETGLHPRIRVCDSTGKKCATIASEVNIVGNYIWDIALFPSQGLMFWSNPFDKNSVTRANMDGTNATSIILEDVYGLYSDEFADKLYWANRDGKSIGHRDLNGNNRNVLLNTTGHPWDLAVDGDVVYFGGSDQNGVYSVTSNREVSAVANTTGRVHHIALYGRSKVSSRPNPCKNSPCANLCVLNRVSYTCL